LLMHHMEDIARKYSFDEMHLTIDPDNQGASEFCYRLGWEKTSTKGEWSGEMRKSLH
jgi:hypothetical protein